MRSTSLARIIFLGILLPLFLAGCESGIGGLFGGAGGVAEIVDSFSSGSSSGGNVGGFSDGVGGLGFSAADTPSAGDGQPSAILSPPAATVHHPEPASIALFGLGIAGLAHFRRRAKRG